MEKEKYLIKSIEEAYQKLKDGEILIAIINNQTTFFKRQKDSILVNDKQKLLKLSVDNFFEIFNNLLHKVIITPLNLLCKRCFSLGQFFFLGARSRETQPAYTYFICGPRLLLAAF